MPDQFWKDEQITLNLKRQGQVAQLIGRTLTDIAVFGSPRQKMKVFNDFHEILSNLPDPPFEKDIEDLEHENLCLGFLRDGIERSFLQIREIINEHMDGLEKNACLSH